MPIGVQGWSRCLIKYDIPNRKDKVIEVISNYVTCLIADRKRGKRDGLLHPLPKDESPLQTLHVDHLGPMTITDDVTRFRELLC